MALKIRDSCINCDVCEPACPNEAISQGDLYYQIDPKLCTECVGHYDEPECQALCPIDDCIQIHPDHRETHSQLQQKFQVLQRTQDTDSIDSADISE